MIHKLHVIFKRIILPFKSYYNNNNIIIIIIIYVIFLAPVLQMKSRRLCSYVMTDYVLTNI